MEKFYIKELVKIFKVSRQQVHNWMNDGKLKWYVDHKLDLKCVDEDEMQKFKKSYEFGKIPPYILTLVKSEVLPSIVTNGKYIPDDKTLKEFKKLLGDRYE